MTPEHTFPAPDFPTPDHCTRHAAFYREEAGRLREVAAASPFGDLRQDFLKMADQYEALARQAEANVHWPQPGWLSPEALNDGAAPLSRPR